MFSADRIFSQRNNKTGLVEWFFNAREGVLGPFESRQQATKAKDEFIQFNIKMKNDGGRTSGVNLKLSIDLFEGSKTKRGQDKDRRY